MKYLVEQYEIHIATLEVEAETKAEAIAKVWKGEGNLVRTEYSSVCEDLGMDIDEETRKQLEAIGHDADFWAPSIHSVSVAE